MDTLLDILILIAPSVVTFLIGLVIKSPIYNTTKKAIQSLAKALEDDKISKEELEELIDVIKNKP